MNRLETYLSLACVVLASLSVVHIAGRPRPILAYVAITLLLGIGYVRLRRQLTQSRRAPRRFDAHERARRIQEERYRKYGR